MSRRSRQLVISALAVALVGSILVLRRAPTAERQAAATAPGGSAAASIDPVARLQERIDKDEVTLQFGAAHGYLESLLKNLNISPSSQTLVFSKSSEQEAVISPA